MSEFANQWRKTEGFQRRALSSLHRLIVKYFLKCLKDISPFCGVTDTLVLAFFWVTYVLVFKARVDPSLVCFLTCVQWIFQIHHLCDTCWPLDEMLNWKKTPYSDISRILHIIPYCSSYEIRMKIYLMSFFLQKYWNQWSLHHSSVSNANVLNVCQNTTRPWNARLNWIRNALKQCSVTPHWV